MTSVFRTQWSVVSLFGRLACLLLGAFCLVSCSVPNLEAPECTQARDVVREFYSFHFGNDMSFSQENLKLRERFLTPRLIRGLQDTGSQTDPFTLVNKDEKPPKAFRVGSCIVTEPNKSVTFTLLLFWKDDVTTEQHEIGVTAEKLDEKWFIDGVKNIGLFNNL